jgi:hypothetical protein
VVPYSWRRSGPLVVAGDIRSRTFGTVRSNSSALLQWLLQWGCEIEAFRRT